MTTIFQSEIFYKFPNFVDGAKPLQVLELNLQKKNIIPFDTETLYHQRLFQYKHATSWQAGSLFSENYLKNPKHALLFHSEACVQAEVFLDNYSLSTLKRVVNRLYALGEEIKSNKISRLFNISVILKIGVDEFDRKIAEEIHKNLLSIRNANKINFFLGFYRKDIYQQLTSKFNTFHSVEGYEARYLYDKKKVPRSGIINKDKSPIIQTKEIFLVTWKF